MEHQNVSSLFFADSDQQQIVSMGVSSRLIYEGSPCDAFPCWNGGTCVEHRRRWKWRRRSSNGTKNDGDDASTSASASYSCRCRDPFEGEHCQQRKAEEPMLRDWCSSERRICPPGMICFFGTSSTSQQCISIQQALQVPSSLFSPTEFLLPLPSLFLLCAGLFLLILLLLFCWANGNTSGFFLLLCRRKANRRKQKDSPREDYAPIMPDDDEDELLEQILLSPSASSEVPWGSGGDRGGVIEMSELRHWAQQKQKCDNNLFSLSCPTTSSSSIYTDNPCSSNKIVHI